MTCPEHRAKYAHRLRALLILRRSNPKELSRLIAGRRVQRGRKWLDRNAPKGWYRNLFEPTETGSSFRARDCRDNECVLTLAFEFRLDGRNVHDQLTFWVVVDHFKADLGHRAHLLGFCTSKNFPKHRPEIQITSAMLDNGWEYALRNYHRQWSYMRAVAA